MKISMFTSNLSKHDVANIRELYRAGW